MKPIESLYDTNADAYDSTYKSAKYRAEDFLTYRYLSRVIQNKSVLDLGCGTGALLEEIPHPSDRYLGLDISQQMLNIAKRKFPQYAFVHEDGLVFKSKQPLQVLTHIYGGYFSVPELIKIALANGCTEIVAHFPCEGRDKTYFNTLENSIGTENKFPSKTDLSRSHKILKINGYKFLKEKFPYWLYLPCILLETVLPIPLKNYTWILAHFKTPFYARTT